MRFFFFTASVLRQFYVSAILYENTVRLKIHTFSQILVYVIHLFHSYAQHILQRTAKLLL